MKKQLLSSFGAVAVAAMLSAVPAYAYSGSGDGGNGGLGNGMGMDATRDARLHVESRDGAGALGTTPNHHVSVYGTGTGTQFRDVNANAADANNRYRTYGNESVGGYRAAEATADRGSRWGWLGLLGLIGLAGLRNANPQRNR